MPWLTTLKTPSEEVSYEHRRLKWFVNIPQIHAVIEKYTRQTRFCLICNYLSRIIPAVQSRCTKFRFAPLKPDMIRPRLDYIIEREGVKASEDGRKGLIKLSGGDMRRVLNVLQCTHMSFGKLDGENVYRCCGQPTEREMEEIRTALMEIPTMRKSYNSECPYFSIGSKSILFSWVQKFESCRTWEVSHYRTWSQDFMTCCLIVSTSFYEYMLFQPYSQCQN